MREALESIFREGRRPNKIRTDKGVEYKNRDVARLLKERGIEHFYSQNELKSSYAERCLKTLKSKLSRYMTRHQTHRWIDVLESVTQSYNASFHRSIKMAPKNVTRKDEVRLWKLQYRKAKTKVVPKSSSRYVFKPGDTVRISHLRQPFDREYDERWTMEYFEVSDRGIKQGLPYYTLKDIMGESIDGTFHRAELAKVIVTDDTVYRIEKVLGKKRGQALVKWLGWPDKFNSWIPLTSLKDYKRK